VGDNKKSNSSSVASVKANSTANASSQATVWVQPTPKTEAKKKTGPQNLVAKLHNFDVKH
jgi:hypothetical protein